jgi:hypothetical protein
MDKLSLQHSEVRGDDESSYWTEESFFDSVLPSIDDSKSSLQTHDSLTIMSEEVEVVTEYGRPHFLMPQQQQVISEDADLEEHSCSDSSFDSDSDNDNDGSSTAFSLNVPRNSGDVSGLSCFDSLSTMYFSEDLDNESSVKDSAHPSCSANHKKLQRSISNSSNKRNPDFFGRIRQSVSLNRKPERSMSESNQKSQMTNRGQSSTSSESNNKSQMTNRGQSSTSFNRKQLQRSISESNDNCRRIVESNRKIGLTNRSHLSPSSATESFRFGAEWIKGVLSVENTDGARHH